MKIRTQQDKKGVRTREVRVRVVRMARCVTVCFCGVQVCCSSLSPSPASNVT